MNNIAEASHCHGGVRRADGPRYSGSVSISGMCFHSESVGTWKPAEYTENLAVFFSKLCLCGPCIVVRTPIWIYFLPLKSFLTT